jgi:hypothetical protein
MSDKCSGHIWSDEKCDLCGDKDWMADKFCAGNPDVAKERSAWLRSIPSFNEMECACESAKAQGDV